MKGKSSINPLRRPKAQIIIITVLLFLRQIYREGLIRPPLPRTSSTAVESALNQIRHSTPHECNFSKSFGGLRLQRVKGAQDTMKILMNSKSSFRFDFDSYSYHHLGMTDQLTTLAGRGEAQTKIGGRALPKKYKVTPLLYRHPPPPPPPSWPPGHVSVSLPPQ